MVQPQPWSYEDFPESTASCEGMETLKVSPAKMIFTRDAFVYKKSGDTELHMHVVSPVMLMPGMPKPPAMPCIIYINGSAWFQQMLLMNVVQQAKVVSMGYVLVLAEYRHSGIASFPAQVFDAKAAVRYVKLHAEELCIDPDKCVLWGDSSGGHTSVMAGITAEHDLICEDFRGTDCSVKAVIDYFGPTDLSRMCEEPSIMNHTGNDSPEGCLLGHVDVLENRELAAKASPLSYISKDIPIPPILIVHGSKDRVVPFAQSALLYDKLKSEGKDARFIRLSGADHGSGEFWNDELLHIADGFIRKYI